MKMEGRESASSLVAAASGRPTLDDQIDAAGLGWYQARLFAMLSLITVADGMEMTVLTMLRAPVMREFGIDKYGFAVLGSVIFGGMLVGGLAGGAIGDLYGRRVGMLAAGTAFCVFGVCSALAPDLYSFAFARLLTGCGTGAMVPVADSLLLEWSPTQWRSKLVMSMMGIAFAVGSILAATISQKSPCIVSLHCKYSRALTFENLCQAGSGILLHETLGGGEGSVWWRVLLMVCTVPGLISLPWMFFALPESGHFLMTNGLPLSFPPSLSSLSLSLSHTLSLIHIYVCTHIYIGRYAEANALLKDLARINGVELAADGEISVRDYVSGINSEKYVYGGFIQYKS